MLGNPDGSGRKVGTLTIPKKDASEAVGGKYYGVCKTAYALTDGGSRAP